jgi:hypothetical protein
VGLAAYIEDFLAAEQKIKSKLGKETRVAPLLPFMSSDCQDEAQIRNIFDLMSWTTDNFAGQEYHLEV